MKKTQTLLLGVSIAFLVVFFSSIEPSAKNLKDCSDAQSVLAVILDIFINTSVSNLKINIAGLDLSTLVAKLNTTHY